MNLDLLTVKVFARLFNLRKYDCGKFPEFDKSGKLILKYKFQDYP